MKLKRLLVLSITILSSLFFLVACIEKKEEAKKVELNDIEIKYYEG